MDPITFSLLMMGASVGSKIIGGLFSNASADEQRQKAKTMAMQNMADDDKEQGIMNRFSGQQSDLNQNDINFNSRLFGQQKSDSDNQMKINTNNLSQKNLESSAGSFAGVDMGYMNRTKGLLTA